MVQGLEVQALGHALLLLVQHLLLGLLEVCVGDPHPALSKGQQPCLRAGGLDVCP